MKSMKVAGQETEGSLRKTAGLANAYQILRMLLREEIAENVSLLSPLTLNYYSSSCIIISNTNQPETNAKQTHSLLCYQYGCKLEKQMCAFFTTYIFALAGLYIWVKTPVSLLFVSSFSFGSTAMFVFQALFCTEICCILIVLLC